MWIECGLWVVVGQVKNLNSIWTSKMEFELSVYGILQVKSKSGDDQIKLKRHRFNLCTKFKTHAPYFIKQVRVELVMDSMWVMGYGGLIKKRSCSIWNSKIRFNLDESSTFMGFNLYAYI